MKTGSLSRTIVIEKPVFANERFVPTNTSALAFDTQTGALCKTYPWGMDHVSSFRELDYRVVPVCVEIADSEKRHEEDLTELRMREHQQQQREDMLAAQSAHQTAMSTRRQ